MTKMQLSNVAEVLLRWKWRTDIEGEGHKLVNVHEPHRDDLPDAVWQHAVDIVCASHTKLLAHHGSTGCQGWHPPIHQLQPSVIHLEKTRCVWVGAGCSDWRLREYLEPKLQPAMPGLRQWSEGE